MNCPSRRHLLPRRLERLVVREGEHATCSCVFRMLRKIRDFRGKKRCAVRRQLSHDHSLGGSRDSAWRIGTEGWVLMALQDQRWRPPLHIIRTRRAIKTASEQSVFPDCQGEAGYFPYLIISNRNSFETSTRGCSSVLWGWRLLLSMAQERVFLGSLFENRNPVHAPQDHTEHSSAKSN